MSAEKTVNVAVAGASGAVGEALIDILQERKFPVGELALLASERSAGKRLQFNGKSVQIQRLDEFDFSNTQIGLFSAGGSVSAEFAPQAAAQGCIVVDNTSHFRNDDDIPLVVSEVNPECVADYAPRNIIANPNCSTAQLVVALKPLHDIGVIRRVTCSTYQSVSGAGNDAMDELFTQTRAVFVNDELKRENFTKQIAFNVIPHIGDFNKDGTTTEEQKMIDETHKMLDPNIAVSVTCVRVPVFVGHSEAVNIEFAKPVSVAEARAALDEAPGVLVVDRREDGGYVSPIECVGEYETFVSRIREDASLEHGLNMWVVSDNLRKGAALNAVQIAELLIEKQLTKSRVA